VDLSSRLRAIVRSGPHRRELTYEPDTGASEAPLDIHRVGELLGGTAVATPFGQCLVVDRRYESDRWHGDIQIGACELRSGDGLALLDPALQIPAHERAGASEGSTGPSSGPLARAIFIDLETTGLSGGAGTVAFLVGVGFFDLGAFQVRQFLLTSYASERALLAAVARAFEDVELIVTYNGKTFDVPVMETRWSFHRMELPLDGVPHFDMLHPARRLWKLRASFSGDPEEGGCRLSTLERTLFDVRRTGDVPGAEIPGRFFNFLRTGDPRPLEPVLEHNRLDLVSLAALTAHAARLAEEGAGACRDCTEALALGRVYERAGSLDDAERCYRRALESDSVEVRGEAYYRLGLRYRRGRQFEQAAAVWRELLALDEWSGGRRSPAVESLRQFAAEALAVHQEHRERDYAAARELAIFALEEGSGAAGRRKDGLRHRLARLERKMRMSERRTDELFWS
jgi:tetratricopeptide (TPR) repeat protein